MHLLISYFYVSGGGQQYNMRDFSIPDKTLTTNWVNDIIREIRRVENTNANIIFLNVTKLDE
jgi:hypothetical protein